MHIVIISAAIKVIVLLKKKGTIKQLLQASQRRVDRRENHAHRYILMDRIGNILVSTYLTLGVLGWICLFFLPPSLNLIRYMQGTLQPEMWIQPVAMTCVLVCNLLYNVFTYFILAFRLTRKRARCTKLHTLCLVLQLA